MTTIRIYTDALAYGPEPSPDAPIAQRLTIRCDGRCWLSKYVYGDGDYVCVSREQFRVMYRERIPEIITALDQLNADHTRMLYFMRDCGSWTVTVSTDGNGYQIQGSLGESNVSNLIREITGQTDLWAMDGEDGGDSLDDTDGAYNADAADGADNADDADSADAADGADRL